MAPKERKDWKLIGTAAPRTDLVGKTNGSATFGLDVRLPEMLFAAVRLSPMIGGSAASLDSKAALALAPLLILVGIGSDVDQAELERLTQTVGGGVFLATEDAEFVGKGFPHVRTPARLGGVGGQHQSGIDRQVFNAVQMCVL